MWGEGRCILDVESHLAASAPQWPHNGRDLFAWYNFHPACTTRHLLLCPRAGFADLPRQGAHISRAVRFLLLTCLLFQVIAAPLFHEREPRKTNSLFVILKFLLLLVACVAGSFLSGVAASMVAGERWMRLALLPFRLIIIVPGISQKTRSRPSCAIMHNRSTPENYDTKPIFLLMHC